MKTHPFVVYLISLLCSQYTTDGEISDRHLFKVMKVKEGILTEVMQ